MTKYNFNEEVLNILKSTDGISGTELKDRFGHKTTRQTRIAIQQLRKDGHPICLSKGSGYFYSTDRVDIERTIRDLMSRANEIVNVCEGIFRGLEGDFYAND